MATVPIDIVGEAYNMRSRQLDAQSCINWYLTIDPTGKFNKALLPRPGLTSTNIDTTTREVRGSFALNNILYTVKGNKLYKSYLNGTEEELGELETAADHVEIIANAFQIFITDGEGGYIYQYKDFGDKTRKQGDFFKIDKTNFFLNDNDPVYTVVLSNVNDLNARLDRYTDNVGRIYVVEIDSEGTTDTFRWKDDKAAATWNEEKVSITGQDQLLNKGTFINFINTTGHNLGDAWEFTVNVESNYYAPIIPAYQDGYGIFAKQGTNQYYITAVQDFSKIAPLDNSNSQVYPDNLVAILSLNQELMLIGNETIEYAYDSGNLIFPFQRRQNLVLNYGCEAAYSIKHGSDNIVFMLAKNNDGTRLIVKIDQYSPIPISTEPLNEELRSYTKVDDAFGMLIQRNGHMFYIITFPTEDKTWVYDNETGAWHEWKSLRESPNPGQPDLIWGKYRGNNHVVYGGQDIIGDSISGTLFKLDENSNIDGDNFLTGNDKIEFPIICERTSQHTHDRLKYVSYNLIQIDFESGVGLTVGQGENPQAMFQFSKDGGFTWSNEIWRSIGKKGKYDNRALWYGLGSARVFTMRLRVSDPVYKVVLGAIADIEIVE